MDGNSTHFMLKHGGIGDALRHASYITGYKEYASREDVIFTTFGNMPLWASVNPMIFWEAADIFERLNGRTYHEFELAIPREISIDNLILFIQGWVDQEIGIHHPYIFAIHNKVANDGFPNIHCHLMFSDRIINDLSIAANEFFKRPVTRYRNKKTGESEFPAASFGGAGKNRYWNDRKVITTLRTKWQIYVNAFLITNGSSPRFDMRSNEARGLGRAEPKIGPYKRKFDVWRDQREMEVAKIRDTRNDLLHVREEISITAELIKKIRSKRARDNICSYRMINYVALSVSTKVINSKSRAVDGIDLKNQAQGLVNVANGLIDRGNFIMLVGEISYEKISNLIRIIKDKQWKNIIVSGDAEFQNLLLETATSASLALLKTSLTGPEGNGINQLSNIKHDRLELARIWLMTSASINAFEAEIYKCDSDFLLSIFEENTEARLWESAYFKKFERRHISVRGEESLATPVMTTSVPSLRYPPLKLSFYK